MYFCTICALYPSLYGGNLPSSATSMEMLANGEEDELKTQLISDFMAKPDLETTSEGLCDHIREIFGLNRQIFNDYQIKAMKKLLIKKSHSQVSTHIFGREFSQNNSDFFCFNVDS